MGCGLGWEGRQQCQGSGPTLPLLNVRLSRSLLPGTCFPICKWSKPLTPQGCCEVWQGPGQAPHTAAQLDAGGEEEDLGGQGGSPPLTRSAGPDAYTFVSQSSPAQLAPPHVSTCARTPSRSVIARVLLADPQMLPTTAMQGPAEKGAYYDKDGHKPPGLQEPSSNRWNQAQHSARCSGHWWFGTQPEIVSEGVSEATCSQER